MVHNKKRSISAPPPIHPPVPHLPFPLPIPIQVDPSTAAARASAARAYALSNSGASSSNAKKSKRNSGLPLPSSRKQKGSAPAQLSAAKQQRQPRSAPASVGASIPSAPRRRAEVAIAVPKSVRQTSSAASLASPDKCLTPINSLSVKGMGVPLSLADSGKYNSPKSPTTSRARRKISPGTSCTAFTFASGRGRNALTAPFATDYLTSGLTSRRTVPADQPYDSTSIATATHSRIFEDSEDHDEYAKFVQSLLQDDDLFSLQSAKPASLNQGDDDDDEDEYQIQTDDDDDDDDDEGGIGVDQEALDNRPNDETASQDAERNDETLTNMSLSRLASSKIVTPNSVDADVEGKEFNDQNLTKDTDRPSMGSIQNHWLYSYDSADLEAELGSLLEEDLEAAVSTLLNGQPSLISASAASPIDGIVREGEDYSCKDPSGLVRNDNPGITFEKGFSKKTGAARKTTFIPGIATVFPTEALSSEVSVHDTEGSAAGILGNMGSSAAAQQPPATEEQIAQLRNLMSKHYQLLLQQSILAVRAAHINKVQKENSNNAFGKLSVKDSKSGLRGATAAQSKNDFFCSGETADDLAEILDGAVGMLQDLDQNRKDAIRNSIQMQQSSTYDEVNVKQKSILPALAPETAKLHPNTSFALQAEKGDAPGKHDGKNGSWIGGGARMLTRAAFTRTLRERDAGSTDNKENGYCRAKTLESIRSLNGSPALSLCPDRTVHNTSGMVLVKGGGIKNGIPTTFDVKGLARLNETFSAIDNSVRAHAAVEGGACEDSNILNVSDHGEACGLLLQQARADYDEAFLPGRRNLCDLLSYPTEVIGEGAQASLSRDEQIQMRKNRHQFTAAEDNLLLRGVNLYGEKEWLLISDRFLPDRSVSVIAQRHARLCLLIYRANGIFVDNEGNLEPPPELPNGVMDFDEEAIAELTPASSPAQFNVHRWSLEEDITLLRAVPLMGHMWAEIAIRLISHRDRGHLRKRYQVLERRVKATLKRESKSPLKLKLKPDSTVAFKSDGKTKAASKTSRSAKRGIEEEQIRKHKQKKIAKSDTTVHEKTPLELSCFDNENPTRDGVTNLTKNIPTCKRTLLEANSSESKVSLPGAPDSLWHRQNSLPMSPVVAFLKQKKDKSKDGTSSEANFLRSEKSGSLLLEQSAFQSPTGSNAKETFLSDKAKPPFLSEQAALTRLLPSTPTHSLQPLDLTDPDSFISRSISVGLDGTTTFESTRMGFERIANEGEHWSQLSGLKKLIENGSDAKPKRDATITEESRDRILENEGGEMERLPNLSIDNSLSSVLSVLNDSRPVLEFDDTNTCTKTESAKAGRIMSSVLERARGSILREQCTGRNLDDRDNDCKLGADDGRVVESPRELSPASAPSRSDSIVNDMSTLAAPDAFTVTSNRAIIVPGPVSMICGVPGSGFTMDGFEFSGFSFSERSRQAVDNSYEMSRLPTSFLELDSPFAQPSHPGRALAINSLMANDLEAITALNSMSNSSVPNGHSTSSPSAFAPKRFCSEEKKYAEEPGGTAKTSFFAKAVGMIQEKEAKRKRLV